MKIAAIVTEAAIFLSMCFADVDQLISEALTAFTVELREFLNDPLPTAHVYGEDIINATVSKGKREIMGGQFTCLTLNTIVVASDFRGRGLGIRTIDRIHAINPYRVTYIDSLINNELYARLLSERWVLDSKPRLPCVYKLKPLS